MKPLWWEVINGYYIAIEAAQWNLPHAYVGYWRRDVPHGERPRANYLQDSLDYLELAERKISFKTLDEAKAALRQVAVSLSSY